jgi:hypothetical protein
MTNQTSNQKIPYEAKIAAAKRWLGARYLLAQPVNKPRSRKLENA